jgi:methylase of polypeptide subunit release factors
MHAVKRNEDGPVGHLKDFGGLRMVGSTFWPKDRRLVDLVFGVVGPRIIDGDRLLEVGAGSGVLTKVIAEGTSSEDVRFVATDREADAFASASSNLAHLPNVDVRRGNLFEPIGEDERFNIIFWNPPWYAESKGGSQPDPARVDEGNRDLRAFVEGAFEKLHPSGAIYVFMSRQTSQPLWDLADEKGYDLSEAGSYKTQNQVVCAYQLCRG